MAQKYYTDPMIIPAKEAVKLTRLPYAKVEVFDGRRWYQATSIEEAIVAQSNEEDVEKSFVVGVLNTATPFTAHPDTRLRISFELPSPVVNIGATT